MKREGLVIISVFIILLLIILLISAFSFGDFWKKITSRAVSCMGATGTDPFNDCGACKVCNNGLCVNIVAGSSDKDNVYGCGANTGKYCDGNGNCGTTTVKQCYDTTYGTDINDECGCCKLCNGVGGCYNVPANTHDYNNVCGCGASGGFCNGAGVCVPLSTTPPTTPSTSVTYTCVSPNSCYTAGPSCTDIGKIEKPGTCASGICCGTSTTSTNTQPSTTITPAAKTANATNINYTCISPNLCKSSCMPNENQLIQYTCASGLCCQQPTDVIQPSTSAAKSSVEQPSTTTSVNAVCGSAINNPTLTKPTFNLCFQGAATEVIYNSKTDKWTWACGSVNGPVSCSATKINFVDSNKDWVDCYEINNGIETTYLSKIIFFDYKQKRTYNNKCEDNKIITTYFCDETTPKYNKITCKKGCENGECIKKIYSTDIIIFKEESKNEILYPIEESDMWDINRGKFLEQFYQIYKDDYDFILVFPTKPLNSHNSLPVNWNISGIGAYYKIQSSHTKKLKSLIMIDFYPIYLLFNNLNQSEMIITPDKNLLGVLIHEIGHHWLVFISGLGIEQPAHWTHNLDLFNGNKNYVDIMGYSQWIRNDSGDTCFSINDEKVIQKFSNLSLYLMGLIPKEQVQPIYVHDFAEKAGDSYYNTWGPSCFTEHKFLETRIITIDEIIQANGERIPSFEDSQKDFRVAFVILTDKDSEVPQGFIDYVNLYKNEFPKAWTSATSYKSKIINH